MALAAVAVATMLLAACGQRGPLYIPGKPGDPAYDRQNRGTTPAGSQPGSQPGTSPGGQPSNPPPSVPNDNRTKRDEVS